MRTISEEKAIARLYGLLDLQKEIEIKFGATGYNIFVFGSYLTTRYVEGESDIFYIDTSMEAPIYCAPLKSQVQFTDYYPEKLAKFYDVCQSKLEENRGRMAG